MPQQILAHVLGVDESGLALLLAGAFHLHQANRANVDALFGFVFPRLRL